jgi:putative transposase
VNERSIRLIDQGQAVNRLNRESQTRKTIQRLTRADSIKAGAQRRRNILHDSVFNLGCRASLQPICCVRRVARKLALGITVPRRPRLQLAGAVYHVMARGNRKSTIFHDNDDRRRFLQIIDYAAASYDLRVRAHCLMDNHYHLVLETPGCNLSDAMQYINGVFAQRSNHRHGHTGHVFEGRFRSLIIQRESYLRRVARYVVRNRVRAGLVDHPADWPWSSYRATAGLEPVPRWLHIDWIQWAFRTDSLIEAQHRYVEFVNASPKSQRRIDLNSAVLGTRQFRTRLLDVVRAEQIDRPMPSIVKTCRPSLTELFNGAVESSLSRDRIIYSARMEHGYCFAEIARFLGIDRSTASKAANRCQQPGAELDAQAR